MAQRPQYVQFSPSDANSSGLANDATAASGDPIPLAATAAPDGLAHILVITPSGAVTGDYTITGLDADGQLQSETLPTDTTNAVESELYYSEVTEILAPSGIGSETVDIGWVDEFTSQTIPIEWYLKHGVLTVGVELTGTSTFSIQGTVSDIRKTTSPPPAQDSLMWKDDTNFASKSAGLIAQLSATYRAIRLVIASYTDGAVYQLDIVSPR